MGEQEVRLAGEKSDWEVDVRVVEKSQTGGRLLRKVRLKRRSQTGEKSDLEAEFRLWRKSDLEVGQTLEKVSFGGRSQTLEKS